MYQSYILSNLGIGIERAVHLSTSIFYSTLTLNYEKLHQILMALWGVRRSSTFGDKESIIRDMVHDFSEDEEHDNNPMPTSSTHPSQSFL